MNRRRGKAHHRVMSAIQMRDRLRQLEAERALALTEGLEPSSASLADLDDETAAAREAYVGTAVTEIATLRAELFGPQLG
jgi:predicted protein tyrosine phosphatase